MGPLQKDFVYFECAAGRLHVPRTLTEVFEAMLDENNAIIIEGNKDRDALLLLGVKKENIVRTAQKPFHQIYDKLKDSDFEKLIVMLDNDREGNAEVRMIRKDYAFDSRFDFKLRKTFFANIFGQFENLKGYIKRSLV